MGGVERVLNLNQVKTDLENNKNIDQFLIFYYEDTTDYIPMQYIKALAHIRNSDILYVDELEEINNLSDPFSESSSTIYVYKTDSLGKIPTKYIRNDLVIITPKLLKDVEKEYSEYILKIPKLEEWQIIDYIKTVSPGLTQDEMEWLVRTYKSNMYRVELEVDKLRPFSESARQYIFEDFYVDHVFETLSEYGIFDFTNAIQNKDLKTISNILSDINHIDIEPTGLITLLCANFKKLIKVWLNKSPTPENTGLKSNQIWAINKLSRTYAKEQLVKVFELVSDMERKLRTGEMPEELIIDYLTVKILSL